MEQAIAMAPHGPRRRFPRSVLLGSCLLLAACCLFPAEGSAAVEQPPSSCSVLARVPGPEDLVLDARGGRLLVSSQDRRPEPWPEGAIWSVPLDPTQKAVKLALAGRRDGCSFHPHGIDMVQSCDDTLLLYVLNHHDAQDRLPERGCFAAGVLRAAPRGRISSVEVFEVEERRLRFLQRLADPEILTNGNDLVARPNGDVWVTDPPAGRLAQVLDSLGLIAKSRVVQYRCASRRGSFCVGTWHFRTDPKARTERIRYANGIAYRPLSGLDGGGCNDDGEGVLFVAGGAERKLHRFRVHSGESLEALEPIDFPEQPDHPNPDNLSWIDADRTRLLVAGHPNLRRFVQHSRASAALSPSAVVEVPVPPEDEKDAEKPIPIFHDSGGLVSAASVALCVDGDLGLGQVFEPAVLRCRLAKPCGGEEGP